MLELLAGLTTGILLGVVAGLLPGIHTNTLVFLALPLFFTHRFPATGFAAFIIGIAITNTFLDFIPAMLLGVPETETALSVLPAHQYMQRGRGFEALKLSVYGGVYTSLLALVLLPILFSLIPLVYSVLEQGMAWILLALLGFMLLVEQHKTRALVVMGFASILGVLALHSSQANQLYILFPVFAGLFGLSNIIISVREHTTIPAQNTDATVDTKTIRTGITSGFAASIIAGFLPGLGAAQSALLTEYVGDLNLRNFIVALGGINTAELFFSFLAIHLIGKARSGAAIAINQIIPRVTLADTVLFIGLSLAAIGVAAVLTLRIGRTILAMVEAVPYTKILAGVTGFLVFATYVLTGWFGLLLLGTSTMLGLLPPLLEVRRSHVMTVLITPTILYYAGVAAVFATYL